MTHTLVAAFDTLSEAQTAKSELLAEHILESDIQLSSAPATADGQTPADGHVHDESLGHKISHFFSSLFGNDEQDKPNRYAVAYPEAYRRGATVLTVTATSDEQADLAENILERNGAIDIDERSESWTAAGPDFSATTHLAGTHLNVDRAEAVDRNLDKSAAHAPIPLSGEDLLISQPEQGIGRPRVVSRVPERPVNRPADAQLEADPSSTLHQETFTPPAADPLKDR